MVTVTNSMEWLMEGLALCFLGLLVITVTHVGSPLESSAKVVYGLSAVMLIVMAIVSLFTGARTSILPMKVCPVVKLTSAVLILVGMTI